MPSDQGWDSNNGNLLSMKQSYLIYLALEGEWCWAICSPDNKVDPSVRYVLFMTTGTVL